MCANAAPFTIIQIHIIKFFPLDFKACNIRTDSAAGAAGNTLFWVNNSFKGSPAFGFIF
jgi:hypothetical protein